MINATKIVYDTPEKRGQFVSGRCYTSKYRKLKYNLKEKVIYLDYKNFVQPICKTLNIKDNMLNDLYEVIEEWIEYVFKIEGNIM